MTNVVKAQITAGPSKAAKVLLDLNDSAPLFVLHEGLTLGRAGADSREVALTLSGYGSDSVVPRAISSVMRAANRTEAYFLWQAKSSHAPTWFRIINTVSEIDFGDTYFDDPKDPAVWNVPLTLTVEAFSYGERVTLPAVTVASSALGFAIVRGIKGDAPTEATITVTPDTGVSWSRWENLLNVVAVDESCPLGAPSTVLTGSLPPVIQWEAEAFTLKGDAGTASSASYSGGSAVTIPEGNTAWREVLSGVVPVEPPPGRYAVFMRCSRTATSGRMRFRMGHEGWDISLNEDAPLYAPLVGAADSGWLPLGTMSFPSGLDFALLTRANVTTPSITLRAQGLNSGPVSSVMGVDRFALVPIELAEGGLARTARVKWKASGPLGLTGGLWNSLKVDGRNRRTGLVAFNDSWYASVIPPDFQGGEPMLHPGMRNIVGFLPKVHNSSGGGVGVESVASVVTIKMSYLPRYNHLAVAGR